MILKSLGRHSGSYSQLLGYISGKELLKDADGKPFVFTHNLLGNSREDYVREFKDNEKNRKVRRKDSIMLYHEVISWRALDTKNINAEVISQIAQKYVALRNENLLYYGAVHVDKMQSGLHLHLAVSGTEAFSGKAASKSKREYAKLKDQLQAYEIREHGLSKSAVMHGRHEKGMDDREYQLKARAGKMSRRDEIRQRLEECFEQSMSKDEFYENVQGSFEIYKRGDRVYGIQDGTRHRFATLGFDEKKMLELDLRHERQEEIESIRGRGQSRHFALDEWQSEEKENDKEDPKKIEGEELERSDEQ